MNLQKVLVKIDRFAAWVLFVSITLFFLSGYGMAQGVLDVRLMASIHNSWLPTIGVLAFLFHSFYAIRLALIRWRIWDNFGKVFLPVFYVGLIATLLIFANFTNLKKLGNDDIEGKESQSISTNSGAQNNTPSNSNGTAQKTFTAAELAKYNGQNGTAAYVAVSGNVYDMSSIFRSGYHQGYEAGKDQTTAFYRHHSADLLTSFQIVGRLQ